MFTLSKAFLPLNTGTQFQLMGAGGPSGFPYGSAQVKPWPYITGTMNFISPGLFGTATTMANPKPYPYPTMAPAFLMQGMFKQSNGSQVVF